MSNKSNEPKTLRKFYRFNVLQPINITTTTNELNNNIMIQTKLTNLTKSPIYIDEAKILPNNIKYIEVNAKKVKHVESHVEVADVLLFVEAICV
jgi:hypothetical protein